MTRSNLGRLFPFISAPGLALPCTGAETATRSLLSRLMSSASKSELPQPQEIRKKGEEPQPAIGNEVNREEEEDGGVNKETGEIGGPRGPEPTRYGDWERNGRCSDF